MDYPYSPSAPPTPARRFRAAFPLAGMVTDYAPYLTTLFVAVGLASIFWSIHYFFAFVLLAYVFIALYNERKILNLFLLTPIVMSALRAFMSSGLGIALITFSNGHAFSTALLPVQLVTVLSIPFMIAIGRFAFRRLQMIPELPQSYPFQQNVLKPLSLLGWFFFFWKVSLTYVLAQLGALDRGEHGLVAQGEFFGIWTYLQLFPRFSYFGFMLLPLTFKRTGFIGRAIIIGLSCFYFLIGFFSGSRGVVFHAIFFIFAGAYLFYPEMKKGWEKRLLIFMVFFFPFISFMDHYRNTDVYRAGRTTDFASRIEAIGAARERQEEREQADDGHVNLRILGSALHGVSDWMIYDMTPEVIPHAGFHNFHGILTLWIPYFLNRNTVPMYDANLIMHEYIGRVDRTGRAITMAADSYRRFGWAGVPVGLFFGYTLYFAVCVWAYKTFLYKNALWGFLLLFYTFTFFQSGIIGTWLSTVWFVFYEIPKHLVLLFPLYFVTKQLTGAKPRGALYY